MSMLAGSLSCLATLGATLPAALASRHLLPLGWYLLFGMVDDVPSVALSLRVDP